MSLKNRTLEVSIDDGKTWQEVDIVRTRHKIDGNTVVVIRQEPDHMEIERDPYIGRGYDGEALASLAEH